MQANYQRGLLLIEQSRYQMAEAEFRQAILADTTDVHSRAMLALCLLEQERFDDAAEQIQEALRLDPSVGFLYYVNARILRARNYTRDASACILEAIERDPEDADYRAFQAEIFLDQKQWQNALESAEEGLALDPEHVGCTNIRAIALTNLGRREEAGATIQAALAKNPENSVTHANQGWTLLHEGKHEKALEHFQEALRLDPENDWAREGIIEALKARHFIYSWMLKYFLWMSRLSSQVQWMVILGGWFGMRFLSKAAKTYPAIAPYVLPIKIIYLLFVFLTWTADPLFNLLLRLNKFGRLALRREQIVASNWVGGCIFIALISLALGLAGFSAALLAAMVFGFIVIPLSAIFKCQKGWPRFAMTAYTFALALCGLYPLIAIAAIDGAGLQSTDLKASGMAAFPVFLIGILLSGWIANILMMQRPKR